jgi:hypothetical protein
MTFDSPLLSPGVQDDMIALAEIADRTLHPAGGAADAGVRARRLALEWLVDEYASWVAAHARDDDSPAGAAPGGVHEGARGGTTRS